MVQLLQVMAQLHGQLQGVLKALLHVAWVHQQGHAVQPQQRVWQQKVQGHHKLVAQLQQVVQQAESRFDPALPELQPCAWPP
jgi:hypothetical protein